MYYFTTSAEQSRGGNRGIRRRPGTGCRRAEKLYPCDGVSQGCSAAEGSLDVDNSCGKGFRRIDCSGAAALLFRCIRIIILYYIPLCRGESVYLQGRVPF